MAGCCAVEGVRVGWLGLLAWLSWLAAWVAGWRVSGCWLVASNWCMCGVCLVGGGMSCVGWL